jgi:hypothetical protein
MRAATVRHGTHTHSVMQWHITVTADASAGITDTALGDPLARWLAHDVLVSLVEPQGSGRWAVSDQVHPQQLDRNETLKVCSGQEGSCCIENHKEMEETASCTWQPGMPDMWSGTLLCPCPDHDFVRSPLGGPVQQSGRWKRPRRCWRRSCSG